MTVRSCIAIISALLFLLTPESFLDEIITMGDWVMITAVLLNLLFYKAAGKHRIIQNLTILLTLNVLLYFMFTVAILDTDSDSVIAVYRLNAIFHHSIDMPVQLGSFINIINILQVLTGFILCIVLVILSFKFYSKKRLLTIKNLSVFCIAFLLTACNPSSKIDSKRQEITDYVPDKATAIKIAEVTWLPIYGKNIYESTPFVARLKTPDIWIVEGTLGEDQVGGVPYIEIQKRDGKVLKVMHGK